MTTFLNVANFIFCGIFALEMVLKLVAYEMTYFNEPWNCLDFLICIEAVCVNNLMRPPSLVLSLCFPQTWHVRRDPNFMPATRARPTVAPALQILSITLLNGVGSGAKALRLARVLRLIRALRVTRTLSAINQLQHVTEALLKCLPRITLVLAFYAGIIFLIGALPLFDPRACVMI